MKRGVPPLAFLLLTLSGGCDFRARAAAEAKHAEMERTMAELSARVARLEGENELLRSQIEAMRSSSTSGTASPALAMGGGPTCTGSGTSFAITQANVDKIFGDLSSSVASQARIVPSFENGVATGFKLFSIRPGSFYASCGFLNGDVVKSVNGHDVNSPDKALDTYTRLKGATRADFEIQRAGKPVVLTITVEG